MMKVSLSRVFFLFIQLSMLLCKEVGVNTPVTLPCLCSKHATVLWSTVFPIKHDIAKCTNGMCQILNPQFQNRSEIIQDSTGGNFDLHIHQAAFNDAGSYRCTCDGKDTEVHLHVIYFVEVAVNEGSDVTLPCYRATRKDFKNIIWKKNNQIILSYIADNKREEAEDGRFTLKEGGVKRGDFSLLMRSVNVSDAGPYRCLINDELDDGEPQGVWLIVKGAETQPSATGCNTTLGLLLGLACLIIICLFIKTFPSVRSQLKRFCSGEIFNGFKELNQACQQTGQTLATVELADDFLKETDC